MKYGIFLIFVYSSPYKGKLVSQDTQILPLTMCTSTLGYAVSYSSVAGYM